MILSHLSFTRGTRLSPLWRAAVPSAFLLALAGCSDDDPTTGDGGVDSGWTPDGNGGAGGAGGAMDGGDAGVITVNRPELVPATDERIASLKVPEGFRVTVVARGLPGARMLAVGPDGSIYVTRPMMNQVLRLHDENDDGDAEDADERTVEAGVTDSADLAGVHGIAISGTHVYLASVKGIFMATLANGQFTGLRQIVGDLPDGGQHPNRTLAVGPDEKLYVSVGSTCNACPEPNTEHATMLRLERDGTVAQNPPQPAHPALAHVPTTMVSPRVFASGLRNTLGFDWHPQTGELWGSDHGSDGLGDDLPPDELNRLTAGSSYGWPYCWGDRQPDPVIDQPSMMETKEAYCARTEPLVVGYQAHSAPIAFLFYRGGQFPTDYGGDAFVAFRGSWNRAVATGYKIARVHFESGVPSPRAGQSSAVEDFMTGFLLDNDHQFGRVAGLAVDQNGALLVSEDSNGVIYRVAYTDGR
jgi:glucose/arabinose dehydrogenase